MPKYNKVFNRILKEEDDVVSDEEVFAQSFAPDSDVGPEDFKTDPVAPGFESRYIEKAGTWTKKLEDFAEWVNGTEGDSLNKQFNDLDREGTPFEGISKHSDKLTKIAADLSALSEVIKGIVLSAARKEQQSMEMDESVQELDEGIAGAIGRTASKAGLTAAGGVGVGAGWALKQIIKLLSFLTADQLMNLGKMALKKAEKMKIISDK